MLSRQDKKRQCVHSCTQLVTYTGRTQAYLHLGTKGPQHFNSVPRSTAASTLSDVLVHAADLTDGYSQERLFHENTAREFSTAKFDARKNPGSMHVENVSAHQDKKIAHVLSLARRTVEKKKTVD